MVRLSDYSSSHSLTQFYSLSVSHLRARAGSFTSFICDQIFAKPLHGPKATDLPEVTTHTVDFGAGGIGPLTARNLDGRGDRAIVIGEKGKGDAEFYSV